MTTGMRKLGVRGGMKKVIMGAFGPSVQMGSSGERGGEG